MAIAFRADNNGVDSDGGNVAAAAPAGAAAGDAAIMVITSYDHTNVANVTQPTGWSLYREDARNAGGDAWVTAVYWKVLAGGDSYTSTCPATYTTWYVACYTGAHATTPLVDTGTFNQGSGTTATGNDVTVTTANSFLLFIANGYNSGLTAGQPTGYSVREQGYDGTNDFADKSVAAGATGNQTASRSNDTWSVTLAVIAPAGAATASDIGDGGAFARNVRRNPVYRMKGRIYVPAHYAP